MHTTEKSLLDLMGPAIGKEMKLQINKNHISTFLPGHENFEICFASVVQKSEGVTCVC